MYRSYDYENGFPPRLYRDPEEIRRDIKDICDKISRANNMLNVRNLISEIIINESEGDLNRKSVAVGELLEAAVEMLSEMEQFENSLDELQCELAESVAMLKEVGRVRR